MPSALSLYLGASPDLEQLVVGPVLEFGLYDCKIYSPFTYDIWEDDAYVMLHIVPEIPLEKA